MRAMIPPYGNLISEPRGPSLQDAALIANAQRIAHYEIAGFGTAHAFAKKPDLDDVASCFKEMAEQSGDIDKKLTKIATGSWLSTGINEDAV
jgi:ferritin-like metal-binding protein YciE